MARNGSGTYNLPAGNPVVTGTTISSTTTNSTFSDIATALTGSLSADGQTTPTGNLPMGGYKHTNVADATVRAQYASAGQVQDSAFTFLTSPAGTNTITATAALGMSAYVTGQRFFFVAAASNTGAVTLNINAIGAKSVTKNGTTALVSGDIAINAVVQVVYDGTQFQLLNPAAVSSFSAGSTGLTPSTATTGAVTLAGTLAVANGGTNNASLAVTAGGALYTDGSKVVNVGAGTSGQVLTSAGASAPTWSSVGGTLNNIQYFTTAGTSTYTPTTGTNFVIVEVVGGGGGAGYLGSAGGAGGTTSFGALVSATGGVAGSGSGDGTGGAGSSGDFNMNGGAGSSSGTTPYPAIGGSSFYSPVNFGVVSATGSTGLSYGGGARGGSNGTTTYRSGGGGGYARKRITSSFSGVTITIGAGGTAGSGTQAGASGIVIVYEYK